MKGELTHLAFQSSSCVPSCSWPGLSSTLYGVEMPVVERSSSLGLLDDASLAWAHVCKHILILNALQLLSDWKGAAVILKRVGQWFWN